MGCGVDTTPVLLAKSASLVGPVVVTIKFLVVRVDITVVEIVVTAEVVDLERMVKRFNTCCALDIASVASFPALTTPGISISLNGKGRFPVVMSFSASILKRFVHDPEGLSGGSLLGLHVHDGMLALDEEVLEVGVLAEVEDVGEGRVDVPDPVIIDDEIW